MEQEGAAGLKNFINKALIVFLCMIGAFGIICFRMYQSYMDLDVLEFRLRGTRLELPCTVEDIQACGYYVDVSSGVCKYAGFDLAILHVTLDENGMVYEIYTDDRLCSLEIYGNVSTGMSAELRKKYEKRIKKAYGEPAEEDDQFRTYKKYTSETEYAYFIKTNYGAIVQCGIVSDKPSS